tara:strand:- start:74 stop:424 length:351 start_codon:yes stop_codon:yes gene_type:complete
MKKIQVFGSCVLIVFTFSLFGCDWSAKWDLRRAEKVLNKAAELNAEFCGEHKAQNAYKKAQDALVEGMFYARRRDINLARDKAQEAKDWAEEAVMWAQVHNEQIRREQEALGAYKD